MISSMTGFGRSQLKSDWGMAVWEIRSINHRYLDINLRLPEMFHELEPGIREIIHQFFHRGKIECALRFHPGQKFGTSLTVNLRLLNQLVEMVNEVSTYVPENMVHLDLLRLLAWDGVVVEEGPDLFVIKGELLSLFKMAAIDVKKAREREGRLLAQGIQERIESIAAKVKEIQQQFPSLLDLQRERLMRRLAEIKNHMDPQRLEQELVYYAQKIDISEEIERLLSHLAEVTFTLEKEDLVGRRLDFMLQELNREANTLASKSADALITCAAVEMKVLIEQIREQVQNIE